MGFFDLNIKQIYDTSTDDFVEDFFKPVLSNAKSYDRGVGYFSSGWLKVNSEGLYQFAENNGHARWVTSPLLSKDDWINMCLGTNAKQNELLYSILSEIVKDLQGSLEKDVLSALAWLIADNIIEFKLAMPRNQLTGEFHDKFGIFTDFEGNQISFSGSYNDSIQGLRNYESIMTFKSWEDNSIAIVSAEQLRFEGLWNNKDLNVRVFDLPQAIKHKIVKLRDFSRPYKQLSSREDPIGVCLKSTGIGIPRSIVIRDYQEEAVQAWFDNSTTGFFEMATGTGKTITSLIAAVRLFERTRKLAIIITCPYKHLVDQWEDVVRLFGFSTIKAYDTYVSWGDRLGNRIIALNNNDTDHLCVITTNATFMTDRFSEQIKKINGPILLIADEAHHFGTEKSQAYFSRQISSRLALSATPNRWFDDAGTAALVNYFGKTVYTFPLQKAINEGFLTPYDYHPILVYLTDEEMETYSELTQKIIPLIANNNKGEVEELRLKSLLLRRSDVLKNAENKLIELRSILSASNKIDHAIFYCSHAQRKDVLGILGLENNIRTHQFTYREDNHIRNDILSQFDRGLIQAIVAIKCLDEGVDVPSSRMAFFLANSTNPREFIQRRGRILRKSLGKEKAVLYDFLTIPPLSGNSSEIELTRSILKKELNRFDEFAKSSQTYHSAYEVIWSIAKQFSVLDF